ncbi:Ubiquitin carboxyl-terminal hydrolase 23 [Camellia lanceoleosa]|uniref:Ubiquitin carboxyl-terminal hydrolase 23 n=1 Tax=Camellia lanceoleosa TaxID=1840588 RepID=A0ACC0I5D8_9ERIC|nr:Ubiquitin carboxyl-terminal hydrolase 23 [Camellia lanceoleosa]
MPEILITPNSHPDESSDPPAPPSIESLFSRKVDFHPAKKPFSGFSNGGGGFRLETLNPTTISDPRRLGALGQCSAQSGLAGKKPDGSEFLDVGLDPELSFGITFRRIVVLLDFVLCALYRNMLALQGTPSESPSAYEKSLVHKIFGGRLHSQVKCMQCSFCSNKFDPFLDLSLEINKAESLHKALMHFTAKEYLDGGERQYQCQRCKQKVKALKQLSIHKAPYVLAIHLKRFGTYQPGQKIDKKVLFGPTLDFKPFVTAPYDGDLKYTLYGVLVHAGWSTHSGHYYCFVRTSSGMWYFLDDHQGSRGNLERNI